MDLNARRLLLVSCRHCARPITAAGRLDDDELAALLRHLRNCSARVQTIIGERRVDVLRHYRVARTR